MKDKPVLVIAVILSLIVEILFIFLGHDRNGNELILIQILKISFQLILIGILFTSKYNIALFILAGYHIIAGLFTLFMNSEVDGWALRLGLYHLIIGIIIYFHDIIEHKLNLVK